MVGIRGLPPTMHTFAPLQMAWHVPTQHTPRISKIPVANSLQLLVLQNSEFLLLSFVTLGPYKVIMYWKIGRSPNLMRFAKAHYDCSRL